MDDKKALTTFPRISNSADVVIPSVPRWEESSSLGSASLRTALQSVGTRPPARSMSASSLPLLFNELLSSDYEG